MRIAAVREPASSTRDPARVGTPAVAMRSLSTTGMPCSRPRAPPAATSRSACFACASACSGRSVTNARTSGSTSPMRSSISCVSSTGRESSRARDQRSRLGQRPGRGPLDHRPAVAPRRLDQQRIQLQHVADVDAAQVGESAPHVPEPRHQCAHVLLAHVEPLEGRERRDEVGIRELVHA